MKRKKMFGILKYTYNDQIITMITLIMDGSDSRHVSVVVLFTGLGRLLWKFIIG